MHNWQSVDFLSGTTAYNELHILCSPRMEIHYAVMHESQDGRRKLHNISDPGRCITLITKTNFLRHWQELPLKVSSHAPIDTDIMLRIKVRDIARAI